MKVKYQITMEVEIGVNPHTELQPTNTKEDLLYWAKRGFKDGGTIAINKVEVSKIGITGITPRVVKTDKAEVVLDKASGKEIIKQQAANHLAFCQNQE